MRLLPIIFLLLASCTSIPKKKETEAAPSGITVEVSEGQIEGTQTYDLLLIAAPGLLVFSWMGYRFIVEKEDND